MWGQKRVEYEIVLTPGVKSISIWDEGIAILQAMEWRKECNTGATVYKIVSLNGKVISRTKVE